MEPTKTKGQGQSIPKQTVDYIPDGGYGWVICFAAFIIQALTIGTTYTFGIIFVDLLAYFDSSESTTAWVGSIQPALLYFTGIVAAPLLNRIGWRAMTIAGSIISALGFGTSALVHNIYLLYLTYGVLTGIGNGLMYVTSMVSVQHYFNRRRALATGLAVSGSGCGTLIFGILMQVLLDTLGWRLTLLVNSGIVLVVGLTAGALLRPISAMRKGVSDKESLVPSHDDNSTESYGETHSCERAHKSYGSISMADHKHPTQASFGNSQGKSSLTGSSYEHQAETTIDTSTPVKLGTNIDNNKAPVSPISELSENTDSSTKQESSEYSVSSSTKQEKNKKHKSKDSCTCCSGKSGLNCLAILDEIFDISLFKNPVFALYSFCILTFAFGYHVPFTYTPERAILLGVPPKQASFLISIMGISNVGFRLMLGWIADRSANIRFYFAGVALTLMGCLGLMVTLFNTYPLMIVYSVLFGALSGSFASLFPVILVDLLGLPVLEKSMGQVLAVSSIAFLVASPMSGLIIEKTGNINLPFMVVGAFGAFGGMVYFLIRCFLPKYGYEGQQIEATQPGSRRKRRTSHLISESFS